MGVFNPATHVPRDSARVPRETPDARQRNVGYETQQRETTLPTTARLIRSFPDETLVVRVLDEPPGLTRQYFTVVSPSSRTGDPSEILTACVNDLGAVTFLAVERIHGGFEIFANALQRHILQVRQAYPFLQSARHRLVFYANLGDAYTRILNQVHSHIGPYDLVQNEPTTRVGWFFRSGDKMFAIELLQRLLSQLYVAYTRTTLPMMMENEMFWNELESELQQIGRVHDRHGPDYFHMPSDLPCFHLLTMLLVSHRWVVDHEAEFSIFPAHNATISAIDTQVGPTNSLQHGPPGQTDPIRTQVADSGFQQSFPEAAIVIRQLDGLPPLIRQYFTIVGPYQWPGYSAEILSACIDAVGRLIFLAVEQTTDELEVCADSIKRHILQLRQTYPMLQSARHHLVMWSNDGNESSHIWCRIRSHLSPIDLVQNDPDHRTGWYSTRNDRVHAHYQFQRLLSQNRVACINTTLSMMIQNGVFLNELRSELQRIGVVRYRDWIFRPPVVSIPNDLRWFPLLAMLLAADHWIASQASARM